MTNMDVNDINIYQGLYGSHEIEFTKGLIHINPFGLIGKKSKIRIIFSLFGTVSF